MEAEAVRMSEVRILLVDDFGQWLNFVVVCFEQRRDMKILGVAWSGPDAIRMAENLEPDLILLDVDLPEINGIQAAEQIRQLVPKCKIIFLTGQSDPEIVQAALRAGGDGYIAKWDASEELMAGVEAVLSGRTYASRSIAKSWNIQ